MINNRFKFKHWQGSKVWLSSLRAQHCWPKKTLAALYVEIIISDSGQQVQVSVWICLLSRKTCASLAAWDCALSSWKKKSTGQGAATKMARVQVGAFPLRTIRSQIVLSWICMAADPAGTLMQASGMPTSPTSVDGSTHDNAVHTLLFVFWDEWLENAEMYIFCSCAE